MVMDPRCDELSYSTNGFKFDDNATLPGFNQFADLGNGFSVKNESVDLNFMDFNSLQMSPDLNNFGFSSSISSGTVDSPEDPESDPMLKYLNQILLEENMEDKPSMFHDPLALQAAEKSFYDVLGQRYPPSHQQSLLYADQNVASPDNYSNTSFEYGANSRSSGTTWGDSQLVVDQSDNRLSTDQRVSLNHPFQTVQQTSSQFSARSTNSFLGSASGPSESNLSSDLPKIFGDSESILKFRLGMEEASKFLPRDNQIILDLDNYILPPESNEERSNFEGGKDGRDSTPNGSRVRKHHHSEAGDLDEARSRKQSAIYVDEAEISELFDRVLLFKDLKGGCCEEEASKNGVLQENEEQRGNKGKNKGKKKGNRKEVVDVDLTTLLISCAQSIAADDSRTAYEQLKQIRQHSSPSGDASQRLAHIFANGLEARLAGTGTQLYASLSSRRISAFEKLKAYQVYLSACPFMKLAIMFANSMIYEAASDATVLHIVDFGILYGFQWPILIKYLSSRDSGPPKLRITGIELPQRGFRPAERVEETGRRLAKYCERFSVPFEYHAIATEKWDAIKIEDFKIQSGEVLAVNSLFRFKNLPDDTVVVDSTRDAVLKLIRKMNPVIFVHSEITGSYTAPFFVTRFREALFHYSSLFDIFDNTISRDDQERMIFEQEFYGREVMNVIACEGAARVERPETYKQWQLRNTRAGFKPLVIKPEMGKKFKTKSKAGYHKDFLYDEDGQWILQGWKGRIICASSCWVPA